MYSTLFFQTPSNVSVGEHDSLSVSNKNSTDKGKQNTGAACHLILTPQAIYPLLPIN